MNVGDMFKTIEYNSSNDKIDETTLRINWASIKELLEDRIFEDYQSFKKAGENDSETWKFWNIFTDEVMQVLIDLTQ